MAEFRISKPEVSVNNNVIAIVPNSAKGDEGEGETTVSAASGGGGSIVIVISDNAEEKIGKFAFDMMSTKKNIDIARGWKKNPGRNVIQVTGETGGGQPFSRVYAQASITNNPEFELSTDGKISLEWAGMPPI
jgi:hypothetical protein